MSIKEGKKPLSQKVKQSSLTSSDVFGNTLAIPEDVQADLDAKGLEPHWLNSKVVYANQGYHPKGWKVYKRDPKMLSDTMGSSFKFGNDPDGIIRRGDCILGVKTKAEHQKHKQFLDVRAKRGYQANADKAQEMRALLGQSGLKDAKVIEGYDEND